MPSKPTQEEWEEHFLTLHRLYIQEDRKLPDVKNEMEKLGFYASKSQYEARFKAWGFQKNLSADTWKYVGHELKKRKRDDKDSEVIVSGTRLPPSKIRKETSRHFYDTKYLVEHANVPSPPGVDVEVFTPVEIKMESFVSPSLPFNLFKKYLQQWFPDPTTPFDMVTQGNGPLPVNKNGNPFKSLPMDSISRVLLASNLHEHNADDLATYLGILMPEYFIGEHLLRAETLACQSHGVAARAQLELLVYLTSNIIGGGNNDENYEREERVLNLIRDSGVMKMRIHPGDSVLEEPTFDAFREKLFTMAIKHMKTDAILWLLELGVDPNSPVLDGDDLATHLPLLFLMERYHGSTGIESSNILLSHGASPTQFCCEDHGTALELAAQNGQVTILKAFMEHLEKLGDVGFNSTLNINTLINLAGQHWREEEAYQTIQYLISLPCQTAHDASVEFTQSTALIKAAKSGNEKLVLLLHENGANMNCHNRSGEFPLGAALDRELLYVPNTITMCELLISLGASPNYDPSGEAVIKLPSALHIAARHGSYKACKLLLDNGAQLHYPDQFKKTVYGIYARTPWTPWTPLQAAIAGGHTRCVTLLIHHGAWLVGDELLCAVRESDDLTPSLVDALIKAGVDITLKSAIGETALHTSIRREFFDVARTLIHAGAVVDFQLTTSLVPWIGEVGPMSELYNVLEESKTTSDLGSIMSIDDLRPLLQAIDSRDSRAIHLVTRCLEKRLWPRRYVSQTLTSAIENRNFEIARILLNRFPVFYGPKHLDEAMRSIYGLGKGDDYAQHLLCITDMLKRRKDINLDSWETSAMRRAVELACFSGDFKPLELLLARLPRKLIADTHLSQSLLSEPLGYRIRPESPIRPWNRKTLESLFTAGCRPNTAVGLLAICTAPMEQVNQLMEYGFDLRQRYSWAGTSLQYAAVLGRTDIVRILLKYGVNVNARPAWKLLDYNHRRRVYKLVDYPRRTALQAAVEEGNLEIMKMLLDAGADINASPGPLRGATTLQLAAIKGYIGIAKSLISMGANINADGAKCFGRTALEGAAEYGRLDMVQFLLEEGCIIDNHRRRQYIRAVFLARSRGHYALARYLKSQSQWTEEDEMLLMAEVKDNESDCNIYIASKEADESDGDLYIASEEDDESDWKLYITSEEDHESISDEIVEPEYGNREQESLDDGQEGAAGWGSGNDNDCIFDVGGDGDIYEVPWI
ncbi:putative Clr5 domain-containing protein [Seiridium unicorne]|uniref:Clr5 domain-containing protein n=1 Tax=Seiridium unicorne TaxID=138068 RepID=A0ABR2UZD5_9PEZI